MSAFRKKIFTFVLYNEIVSDYKVWLFFKPIERLFRNIVIKAKEVLKIKEFTRVNAVHRACRSDCFQHNDNDEYGVSGKSLAKYNIICQNFI